MRVETIEEGKYQYSAKINVCYQKAGYGPNQVLLIHGFACSRLNRHSILDKFPTHKYTFIIPDLKGYGGSSAPVMGRIVYLIRLKL